jgi:rod shape-determining protein MreB
LSVSPKTKRERSKNTYLQRSLLLDWVGAFGAEDIGIDLGTSNAVIYVKNKGLVFPEAAVVAKNENTKKIFAYGVRAGEMEGRLPKGLQLIRPLKTSAIIDYNSAAYLMNALINQSYLKGIFFHPRLLMCVPVGISKVQRRALLEAAVAVGARKTVLIDQPIAAVMGLGLKLARMQGVLIVDIGGGSTKISVVSRHGVVNSHFSTESGMLMDEAIMNVILEKYHIRIGRKAAETLKMALGVEWDLNRDTRICEVCGISTITELPVKIAVTGEIVAQALNPILYRIFSGITSVIQMTPPAILGDIREHGIVLIGGVAQLKGLKELVLKVTDMKAHVADHPSYVNAVGAGSALEYMDYFRDSLQDLH